MKRLLVLLALVATGCAAPAVHPVVQEPLPTVQASMTPSSVRVKGTRRTRSRAARHPVFAV